MANADERRVGEKYRYHILGENIHTNSGITDIEIQRGREFFTKSFGVRITNIKDLDALDIGIEAYYQRPEKDDIPRQAVNRAVLLKQTFFPYQKWKWNVDDFNRIPYNAPIPNIVYGKPVLEAEELNINLQPAISVGKGEELQPTKQLLQSSVAGQEDKEQSSTPVKTSFISTSGKKAWQFAKKNWWLILLPVPVIVVVLAIKRFRH